MKDKKFIVLIVMFLATLWIAWGFFFRVYIEKDTVNIHELPKAFGDWKSEELSITDEEYAILETKNAFVRRYFTASGQEAFLFIVYSQHNRKVAHPPEICYTGGGVSVLESAHDAIPVGDMTIDANRLLLEQNNTQQFAYYWFKVGGDFTPNYWKQQILIGLKNLVGQPASSALIRVSVTVDSTNKDEKEKEAHQFIKDVAPHLLKYLP